MDIQRNTAQKRSILRTGVTDKQCIRKHVGVATSKFHAAWTIQDRPAAQQPQGLRNIPHTYTGAAHH